MTCWASRMKEDKDQSRHDHDSDEDMDRDGAWGPDLVNVSEGKRKLLSETYTESVRNKVRR